MMLTKVMLGILWKVEVLIGRYKLQTLGLPYVGYKLQLTFAIGYWMPGGSGSYSQSYVIKFSDWSKGSRWPVTFSSQTQLRVVFLLVLNNRSLPTHSFSILIRLSSRFWSVLIACICANQTVLEWGRPSLEQVNWVSIQSVIDQKDALLPWIQQSHRYPVMLGRTMYPLLRGRLPIRVSYNLTCCMPGGIPRSCTLGIPWDDCSKQEIRITGFMQLSRLCGYWLSSCATHLAKYESRWLIDTKVE
jgi:hypothetical protein